MFRTDILMVKPLSFLVCQLHDFSGTVSKTFVHSSLRWTAVFTRHSFLLSVFPVVYLSSLQYELYTPLTSSDMRDIIHRVVVRARHLRFYRFAL